MTSLQIWKRHLVFWAGAVMVGIVAILFAVACNFAQNLFSKFLSASSYLSLIVTPLGFAAAAFLTRRFFPGSQGSGIPQTIAALELSDLDSRGPLLSLRIAMAKILLTVTGLLSGASIGREGPTVQIGASIMHSLRRFAHFSKDELDRGLILAGGAAGIAAAFNTPLAGVVFAIEEMSHSLEQRTSGTMLIAVILAGVVSLAILGNYDYFGDTSVTLGLGMEWTAVAACGIIGGTLGGLFSRILIGVSHGIPGPAGILMKRNPVAFAALCGLMVAALGIISGGAVYGTGYEEAKGILEGTQASDGYGILKILATLISYISGIPGGVFSPSLSAGAGLGALVAQSMPGVQIGAVVILGMVAYFSGVVQAPITAFVIVMEMTDNHAMVLPLMATSFVAYSVSRIVCPTPLYKSLAQGFIQRHAKTGEPAIHAPRQGA